MILSTKALQVCHLQRILISSFAKSYSANFLLMLIENCGSKFLESRAFFSVSVSLLENSSIELKNAG